jgi:hypothetical protein
MVLGTFREKAAVLIEKRAMDSKQSLSFYLHIWLSFEFKTPI